MLSDKEVCVSEGDEEEKEARTVSHTAPLISIQTATGHKHTDINTDLMMEQIHAQKS